MVVAAQALAGQPILILKEGTSRETGRNAQRTNIMVGRAVAEAVRSSLGPKGMDKMLVDSFGDVTITSDGATILKEMDVEHPAAKMMVEVAKAQDDEAGDGTTSAVVIAGELLKYAEELLDQDIHSTVIISGYRKAQEVAKKIIEETAIKVDPEDVETLKKVAETAMASKVVAGTKGFLADIAVQAVKMVEEVRDGKRLVDIDNIKVEKKEGESITETTLVKGIVIDKEIVHQDMPKRVENAKIALLQNPLEIEKTEMDAKIRITTPEQMKAFLDEETKMLKEMVEKIREKGANVVFCQKGIDDIAQHFLAKAGIVAVRRVKKSDMEKLAKATGGKLVTNLDDLTEEDLGYAGLVEERKIGEDYMVFVEDCKNPRSVTILVRGGGKHIVDEAERSIHDAICVTRNVIEDGKIVPGGGAIEIEISKGLREYAETLSGREQLAVKAFADAVEIIPKTLATNAGLDQINKLVELRAEHQKKNMNMGLNLETGKAEDMVKAGIIEPARIKIQALKSATEAAEMILRIDDVIAASKEKTKKPGEGAGEGAPGGMPGGAPPY